MPHQHTTYPQKLTGTVKLLRQSLKIIMLMAGFGVAVAFLVSYAFGMIIVGVCLFAIGGSIIAFRRILWDYYERDFKSSKRKWTFWFRPSKLSYVLNIWFVWPLVMLAGLLTIVIGVFSSL